MSAANVQLIVHHVSPGNVVGDHRERVRLIGSWRCENFMTADHRFRGARGRIYSGNFAGDVDGLLNLGNRELEVQILSITGRDGNGCDAPRESGGLNSYFVVSEWNSLKQKLPSVVGRSLPFPVTCRGLQ